MGLEIKELKELSNLLIYGASNAAKDFIKEFNVDVSKITLATSSGGTIFSGQKVNKYTELANTKPYNIIIASQFFYEIYKIILANKIPYSNIYCYNIYKNEINLVEDLLRSSSNKNVLYAIYDLEQNPASFDACVFANAAELCRQENNLDGIHFIVPPPILKYGRLCDANFYNNGSVVSFNERIDNLLMPIFSLIPSRIGISILANREELAFFDTKHIYPNDYKVDEPKDTHNPLKLFDLPKPIGFFKASERAKKYIEDSFSSKKEKKIICFTVREYLDERSRNNNIPELKKFIMSLCKETYYPVIIRDTINAGKGSIKGLENYEHFSVASLDIDIRMALYESVFLNIFCNNGPVMLAAFNKNVDYIIFKLVDESISCTNSTYFKTRFGIDRKNKQFLWACHEQQQIVWEEDSLEIMTKEFNKFVDRKN